MEFYCKILCFKTNELIAIHRANSMPNPYSFWMDINRRITQEIGTDNWWRVSNALNQAEYETLKEFGIKEIKL